MPVPPGSEESEARFADIWAAAIAKHAELTGHRLDDANTPKPRSAETLLLEIDKQQAKFSNFRGKRRMLFDVLGGALKPIELVGNLAAGGASMAFPPSSLVFGAVTYMINAGHGVSAAYDAIIDLFTEVKDFTTRLSVHARQNISRELRGIVTEILTSLIYICDLSAKLIKDGRVLKYFKGVLLGEDEKIQGELGKLRRLTESEERMVGALTLSETTWTGKVVDGVSVTVTDISLSMNEVREQMSSMMITLNESVKQEKDDGERKQLEKIRLALNPSTTPQELFDSITTKRVPGTGDWIREEPLFQAWIEREKPILWLSGGPGAGKSFLSSNIIQYLLKMHPQGVQDPSRTSVGYFFCKDYDPDLRTFNKALRSLAYQICLNDPVYAKHCAQVLSFPEDVRTTESLWKKLFLDFFRNQSIENTVIFLIDGLDEALDDERKEFLELLKDFQNEANEAVGKLRIQLVMVGRPELNWDIEETLDDAIPMIEVSANRTKKDMKEYIAKSVASVKMLRRVSKELREEIITKLTDGADGMFLWVDLMIKELKAKHKPEQIKQAIAQPPKGLADTLRQVLERFSKTLQEDEIADLNTLLAWVVCAKRQLTLGELDNVMKLKSSDGEGMIYLEGELRKRYASFFTLTRDDGRTTEDLQGDHSHRDDFLNDEGEDEEGVGKYVNNDPGMDDDFGEEIGIVSNPRTTVVHFAHGSIGDFFRREPKASDVGVKIHEDETAILKMCMNFWCDDDQWKKWEEASQTLTNYATTFWQQHLEKIDLSAIDTVTKEQLGGMLIATLREEKLLSRWGARSYSLRPQWIYTDTYTKVIFEKWLKDEDVTAKFSEDDKQWVSSLESHIDLMKPLHIIMAREWLKNLEWNAVYCFMSVWAFVEQTKRIKENLDPLKEDRSMTDFPPTAIIEVAEWPQYEKNGMWYARVAKMLRDAGHIDEAIHYFEESLKAQEPDNSQWLVQGGLAIAYSQRSEYEKAIETVKKAQEKFSEAAARDPEMNTKYKAYAYNHSKSEGEWNIKLGNKDKGVENYKTALKLLPGDLDLVLRVLVIYHEEKKWEEIIKMLEEMQSDILPGTGHSRLVEITQLYTFDDQPLYNIVVHAARETGRLDFAKQNILTSMRAARKDDNVGTAGLLQYWLGLFTLRHERNKDRAIHIWESLMATSFASQSVSALGYARILASIQLSIRYFDKAITAGKGTAEADLYIHKLESLSKQKASNPLDRTPEEVGFVFSTRDTTLTLGLLYRVFGNDKDARECFKAHIKLGIDLLTDEDPSNDWLGFMKMADVLNFADDRVNLDAAYSLLGPTVQDEGEEDGENGGDDGNDGVAADIIADEQEKEQSPATTKLIPAETNNPPEAAEPAKAAEEDPAKEKDEVEADDLDGTVDYSCDGPCERFFTKPDPLHLCRYCLNIGFCDDCIKLQKSDQMPFMICDPKHEFYKPAKVTKRLGKGMVLLKGEEVPIRGWLEGLREEWGL